MPGIIEWPARLRKPFATDVPCCTSDIYPTVVDLLGLKVANQVQPIDGISLRDLIDGRMKRRPKPIAFWKYPSRQEGKNPSYLPAEALKGWWRTFRNLKHPVPATKDFQGEAALIDNQYKLLASKGSVKLYDIAADPQESKDLAGRQPQRVAKMKAVLEAWQASVEKSLAGQDYPAAHR